MPEPTDETPPRAPRSRRHRIALTAVYWLLVLVVSLAVAVAFVAFLVSRDDASLDRSGAPSVPRMLA